MMRCNQCKFDTKTLYVHVVDRLLAICGYVVDGNITVIQCPLIIQNRSNLHTTIEGWSLHSSGEKNYMTSRNGILQV